MSSVQYITTTELSSTAMRDDGLSDFYRGRVQRMLSHYAPHRLEEVPELLRNYQHRESDLIYALTSEYGPEPSADSPKSYSYTTTQRDVDLTQIDRSPGRNAPSSPKEAVGVNDYYRRRMLKYFQHYDPARVSEVDSLLHEHEGNEHMLMVQVVSTYGPEPRSAAASRTSSMRSHRTTPEPVRSVSMGRSERRITPPRTQSFHGTENASQSRISAQQSSLDQIYQKYANNGSQHKIADVLAYNQEHQINSHSFEFFPPKTADGEKKLMESMENFRNRQPVFIDFTWGAGGSTSEQTARLCKECKDLGFTVNMHLTCTNMDEGKVTEALNFCQTNGICNILALRGDPPTGQEWKASAEGFTCALDLVRFIKANYGDYFSVGVAGYPEGHPNAIGERTRIAALDMEREYEYLKQKVDAGAGYIITQLFYDADLFLDFVQECRGRGISVPILPGMLPMTTYKGFKRMTDLCKTYVPPAVEADMNDMKDDDAAVKQYGINLVAGMVTRIRAAGTNHIHFYTLNQTYSTFQIMDKLTEADDAGSQYASGARESWRENGETSVSATRAAPTPDCRAWNSDGTTRDVPCSAARSPSREPSPKRFGTYDALEISKLQTLEDQERSRYLVPEEMHERARLQDYQKRGIVDAEERAVQRAERELREKAEEEQRKADEEYARQVQKEIEEEDTRNREAAANTKTPTPAPTPRAKTPTPKPPTPVAPSPIPADRPETTTSGTEAPLQTTRSAVKGKGKQKGGNCCIVS